MVVCSAKYSQQNAKKHLTSFFPFYIMMCVYKTLCFYIKEGEFAMKKMYKAPQLDTLMLYADEAIAEDPNSFPYNDGELGWT